VYQNNDQLCQAKQDSSPGSGYHATGPSGAETMISVVSQK